MLVVVVVAKMIKGALYTSYKYTHAYIYVLTFQLFCTFIFICKLCTHTLDHILHTHSPIIHPSIRTSIHPNINPYINLYIYTYMQQYSNADTDTADPAEKEKTLQKEKLEQEMVGRLDRAEVSRTSKTKTKKKAFVYWYSVSYFLCCGVVH